MKAYSLIVILVYCVCECTSVGISPELKKNILNFGYRINFKYERMLSHSFDRFYVVTILVLLMVKDLKISTIDFCSNCSYLGVVLNKNKFLTQYIPNIKNFCKKIVPFTHFTRENLHIITKQLITF